MKQFLSILTLSFFVIQSSIASDLANHAKDDADHKLTVITTFTILQDIAQNVAGDAAEVLSITKPGTEIHGYQPTPKDIVKTYKADLILWNGMNLESWFKKFYQQLDDVPSIILSEGIKPISIYKGSYAGKPNPHAWMSIPNVIIYVDNILAAFVKHDAENAQIYQKNAQIYKEKLVKLHQEVIASLAVVPKEKRYLVTSEGAFSYLADVYGFKEAYLWPINADQQGSPKQIKRVIDTVREKKIPVIFSESTVSDKPAKQVANETNANYGGVLYVDSLSAPNGEVPTYLDLIKVTTRAIINGFNSK